MCFFFFFSKINAIWIATFRSLQWIFRFVHASGMMTYLKILTANFESFTWIIFDSKLLHLKNDEIENDTNNAMYIFGNLHPRQSVDLDASMERDTWKDRERRSCGTTCLDNRYR